MAKETPDLTALTATMDQVSKSFEEVANAMVKYRETLVAGGIKPEVADRMTEKLNEEWAMGIFRPKADLGKLFGA